MVATLIEKPWGQLGADYGPVAELPHFRLGEVQFEHPNKQALPMIIKYLYTGERLSVQVHPDDRQARAAGHACGKDEMWIVLEARPGATIGLGLKRNADREELARAAGNGTIVDLMDWRPVRPGDVIYNPAGTIHAAGAGLVLLEVQQAIDLTYRLYDYGSARPLHLAEGLAVARGRPHFDPRDCSLADGQSRLLAEGPYFGAAWCAGDIPRGVPRAGGHYQIVNVSGDVSIAGRAMAAGECSLVASLGDLRLAADARALIAWPTPEALAAAA